MARQIRRRTNPSSQQSMSVPCSFLGYQPNPNGFEGYQPNPSDPHFDIISRRMDALRRMGPMINSLPSRPSRLVLALHGYSEGRGESLHDAAPKARERVMAGPWVFCFYFQTRASQLDDWTQSSSRSEKENHRVGVVFVGSSHHFLKGLMLFTAVIFIRFSVLIELRLRAMRLTGPRPDQ
eukprot:g14201.t1